MLIAFSKPNYFKRLLAAAICLPLAVSPEATAGQANYSNSKAAKIFEPGKFSTTEEEEYGVTFSPNGEYIYYTHGKDIYWARQDANGWSDPQIAEFSKGAWIAEYLAEGADVEYFNWDPVISPDGSKLYFMSSGLVGGKIIAGEDGDLDLWVMDRLGDGYGDDAWGPPRHMGPEINSPDYNEGSIGVSDDGTAYFFSSGRPDGIGSSDIYVARYENGHYLPAVNIGAPINTSSWDGHTFVDPKGSYILYISNNLPGGYGDCDIYVSHRTETGWAEPVNLGPNVNSEVCELTPSLSPDGKILFIGRWDRADNSRDIYSVELKDTDFYARPDRTQGD